MSSTIELLAGVPLFTELLAADLREIAESVEVRSFEEGEHIFQIGEPGRSLFIVTQGSVQVHHPNRETQFELAQFGSGDFFGEMALLNDAPRSASARAMTRVDALVLDKIDFRRIVMDKPDVALRILQAMSVRVRSADELIHELTQRAVRDRLTGLLNKQAFHERLSEEIARTRRYGISFSLVVLDFDDFDAVNESLGRERGDEVLSWVGRLLGEHTRGSDVPFRLEDDSFTILCPATPAVVAATVATRLSTLISEAKPPIDRVVELSISTGTATCPDDAEDGDALYAAAKRSLESGGSA